MSLLYLLQLLVGFFGLVLIALPFSQNLKNVNYKSIGIGIIFQIVLAILLLKVPLIVDAQRIPNQGRSVTPSPLLSAYSGPFASSDNP